MFILLQLLRCPYTVIIADVLFLYMKFLFRVFYSIIDYVKKYMYKNDTCGISASVDYYVSYTVTDNIIL